MAEWKLSFNYEESPADSKLISLFTEVEFEDVKMKGILDCDVLFLAIQESGLLPLFTCSCGTFFCGGYYVEVLHINDGLILRNTYKPVQNPTDSDILEVFEYELSWEDLYIIASEVYYKLIEIKDNYPGCEICFGTFGEGILNKIDGYGVLLNELRNK